MMMMMVMMMTTTTTHTKVYPKVFELAAWSENCKWYS
jgi:hypothetical protein